SPLPHTLPYSTHPPATFITSRRRSSILHPQPRVSALSSSEARPWPGDWFSADGSLRRGQQLLVVTSPISAFAMEFATSQDLWL
ncbi:hypothetical protein Drorol1_Dr00022034, partial [Drosera rotundifolia]